MPNLESKCLLPNLNLMNHRQLHNVRSFIPKLLSRKNFLRLERLRDCRSSMCLTIQAYRPIDLYICTNDLYRTRQNQAGNGRILPPVVEQPVLCCAYRSGFRTDAVTLDLNGAVPFSGNSTVRSCQMGKSQIVCIGLGRHKRAADIALSVMSC